MSGLLHLLSGWPGSAAVLLIRAALAGSAVWRFQQMRYQGEIARLHAALAAEQHKLTRLQLAARQKIIDQERQQAAQLAEIGQRYQQEMQHEQAKNRRTLAELDAARHRLYISVKAARCDARLPASAASASSRDDPTRAELSAASARFLVGEAGRADQSVRQLSACQAVVRADRDMQSPAVETGARRDNGRDRSTTGDSLVVEKMEEGFYQSLRKTVQRSVLLQ